MYSQLFSSYTLRSVTFRNRIVFPAMGTHFADENCYITDQLIQYQIARVLGGSGLNFLECCSVNVESSPSRQPSIAEDRFLPGHRRLTKAIHDAGGKCGIQLWQGGAGAGADPKCRMFIPDYYDGKHSTQFIPPWGRHEADGTVPAVKVEELHRIAGDFGKAAARAITAGYDVIEFHCGHNYLPHCMLSKAFNHRSDEYGGSLQNRMRFPLECIRAIRKNIPESMPLFMRISAFDEPDLDNGKGGNSLEDNILFCKAAREEGVDLINVSRGNFSGDGNIYEVPPLNLPCGFNVESAAAIRKEAGIPTMAVGRINRPELAEQILEEGKADLICMGRAQIADPEFCNKCRDGRTKDIRYCIGCNQGCSDGFVGLPHITCMRNPFVGREKDLLIKPVFVSKRILVAGGGMGGMECALYLKRRGHEPVIIEQDKRLGGQFIIAGVAPGKEEFIRAVKEEAELVRRAGIEVRFNTKVTPELIREMKPDEVVFATGAGPLIIPIKGADLPNVTNAHAILKGDSDPRGKVIVIGGGIVGVEIAEFLTAKGHDCTIIEMKDTIAADLGYYRRMLSMKDLETHHVRMITEAFCREIDEEGVFYEHGLNLKKENGDSVVMAAGAKSFNIKELQETCDELSVPYHIIGDAKKARRALNSIEEGVETALII